MAPIVENSQGLAQNGFNPVNQSADHSGTLPQLQQGFQMNGHEENKALRQRMVKVIKSFRLQLA
jgi:hypothetical protein